MRQRCAKTLVTEEPDEGNLHVRTCGGAGWVTTGSTRTAEIAARRVVRFKIGKVFKDAVDRPAADG